MIDMEGPGVKGRSVGRWTREVGGYNLGPNHFGMGITQQSIKNLQKKSTPPQCCGQVFCRYFRATHAVFLAGTKVASHRDSYDQRHHHIAAAYRQIRNVFVPSKSACGRKLYNSVNQLGEKFIWDS